MGGVLKPTILVGGRRIIDRQLEALRPLFDRLVIVCNDERLFADTGIEVIPDRVAPGRGALAGLDAALAFFSESSASDAVVCVAGDMPFLQPALLRRLRDAPVALAVVPRLERGPEPLCARYAAAFGTAASAALASERWALHALLGRLAVSFIPESELRELDPELRTFININTPEDLEVAEAVARRSLHA